MSFVKKCQWCGKEFTTKRYPTKFCGPSCYNKHKRAEKKKRKLELIKRYDSHINVVIDDGKLRYIKQCDHCGMEFRRNSSDYQRKTSEIDQSVLQPEKGLPSGCGPKRKRAENDQAHGPPDTKTEQQGERHASQSKQKDR